MLKEKYKQKCSKRPVSCQIWKLSHKIQVWGKALHNGHSYREIPYLLTEPDFNILALFSSYSDIRYWILYTDHTVTRDNCTSLIIFLQLFFKYLVPQSIIFKHYELIKWMTTFSQIFHFSLIDLSKNSIKPFFRKCPMLQVYVELCTRSKRKKMFWRDICLPPQNARTRDYCISQNQF